MDTLVFLIKKHNNNKNSMLQWQTSLHNIY